MAAPTTTRTSLRGGRRTPGRGGRPRSVHPALLVILAVVFLAAVVRLALPSLAGGGNLAPFTPIIPDRHLVVRGAGTLSPSGHTPTTEATTARDPFAAPPGY